MTTTSTSPTVLFTDDVAGIVNRATATVTYTLRFSESVTGLEISDLTVTNATIGGLSGAGDTWTLTVVPMLNVGAGSIGVTLKAGAVLGSGGGTNEEARDTSQAIDTRPPAPPKLVTGSGFDTLVDPRVELVTTMGSVVVELDPDRAPVTVANMLAYVNMGFYDGTLFHRVIPNFVIQGGGYGPGLVSYQPLYSPIPLESDNGLSNLRGTLAMARTNAPDSATTQFYVNHVDNTGLDYRSAASPGYAVFGRVVSGIEVVDSIASVPTTSVGGLANVPIDDVTILSARQIVAGSANSTTGRFAVEGLEVGALWAYSLNAGVTWTYGSGSDLYVPEGSYAPDQIRVAQFDAAGNQSFRVGTYDSALVVDLPDSLVGTAGVDTLAGGFANDTLVGLEGDDVLEGGGGDDVIDGGPGADVAVYGGALAGYQVMQAAGGYTVRHVAGGDGADALTGVEALRFADMTVNLTVQATAAATPQAEVDRLVELYVAFFNRTPDADGLSYWIGARNAGQTVYQIAESFYDAGVYFSSLTGYTANMTDADFVRVVYRNVLRREDVTDPTYVDGVNYWAGELAAGRESRGSLVSTILDSAHTFKGDPTWGWVADLLDNKIAVSRTFAIDWGLNYNTPEDSIEQGMAIAAAISPQGTDAAIALIGVDPGQLELV